jgi:Holliday junction resolvase
MTSPERVKGFKFERDVVKQANAMGLKSVRAWGSNGASLGYAHDVDLTIESYKVQAKIRKKMPEYLTTPESCDILILREDNKKAKVIMDYQEWLELLVKLKQHGEVI